MDKLKDLKLRFLIIESSQSDPIIESVFPQKTTVNTIKYIAVLLPRVSSVTVRVPTRIPLGSSFGFFIESYDSKLKI